MKIPVLTILLPIFSVSYVSGQPESPDLELEGYQIVGKDTRVFSITGDRKTTVEFVAVPVLLPREERDVETSRGLIGEDERFHRTETFSINHGFYTRADVMSGSNSLLVLWGKASMDMDGKAGTVRILNRMAKENTSVNSAPLIQDIEAVGYYDGTFARLSVDMEYGREDDEIGDKLFRERNRSIGRYRGGVTMRLSPFEKWDVSGRFIVSGSGYEDFELTVDEDESLIGGNAQAVSDLGATTVILDASGHYVEMSDLHGTVSTFNGTGEWLFGNSFGLKGGASLTFFKAPGDDKTKTRSYPHIAMDWALTPGMFLKAAYKPGVVRHSFADLYGLNGLVMYDVPMLFEDRKVDFSGELGLRHPSGFTGSMETFYTTTEDMPVFTLKTIAAANDTKDFYSIVNGTEIDLKGVKIKGNYDRSCEWGIGGSMTFTDASGDSLGNVPYIPAVEAALKGYFIFQRFWKFRCSIRYVGKHKILWNSNAEEDYFFIVDLGMDRQLWKQYLSLYVDVRNLTNEDGAWWTNRYQIPGAGLYAGIMMAY